MASEITVNIELDKFYQDFLREYFDKKEGVFSFPKNHDLGLKLQFLLSKPPADFKPEKNNNEKFTIALLFNEYKSIYTYNYLSKTAQKILASHIRNFFSVVFHEEMNKLRKVGFQKKECVLIFLEKYNLDPTYYDRLIKDYQRYVKKISNLKYYKKVKKAVS